MNMKLSSVDKSISVEMKVKLVLKINDNLKEIR